jgi:uroporphyrin-3 C-methyltransferase
VAQQDTAPEFDPFASEPETPPRKSGGGWLGGLALLLVLALAGWNGWTWWQDRQADDAAVDLEAGLDQARVEQQALRRAQQEQAQRLAAVEGLEMAEGLARLDAAIDQAESVAGSDRARLAALEATLQELTARVDGLEGRVAAVVVRGESPRQGLDLAEVDYLLRSANERLRLYGDARTADQALALADAQLAAMDDPVYLSVRQAIAAARLDLEAVEPPDTIALTERLGQLQAAVPGLPFPGEVAVRHDDGDVETAEDPGVWARFTAAMSDLVSVRRRADDASLVSLEDKDFVRQGLWLQLETARLALIREDDEAFQAALARAEATVTQYFDGDAARVERFATQLEQLAGVGLAVAWPDISEPWTRLQGIRSASVPAPAASPVAEPENVPSDAGSAAAAAGEGDEATATTEDEGENDGGPDGADDGGDAGDSAP